MLVMRLQTSKLPIPLHQAGHPVLSPLQTGFPSLDLRAKQELGVISVQL